LEIAALSLYYLWNCNSRHSVESRFPPSDPGKESCREEGVVEFRGFRTHVATTCSSAPILCFYVTLHLAAASITDGALPRGIGAVVRQRVDV
jgi:hypothetical protein